MRKIPIILALLFFASLPASATTYYVDNCVVVGNDSNNGTATGTPWLTITKVNASTFAAGDSILFERTCIWYGVALTVPNSGTSGNPITFGAYGSGANPIIKGATNINTSGYVLNSGATFTYVGALATTVVAAWENDNLIKLETSAALVEAHAGSWFSDGSNMYIHASDGSNVASNGKLYDYVDSSSPSFTMWDNAKNYLVINGIDQSETYNTSTGTLGGLYLTGSNSVVENLSFHDHYRHGFCFYLTANNDVATNVTGYGSYGTAPVCIYGSGTTGNLLQNSTLYNDTALKEAYVGTGVWGVVVAHGGSNGNTVDSCLIYSTAASPGGWGITVGDANTTLTVSHSLIYGTFTNAVIVGAGGVGNTGSVKLFGNLIDISAAGSVGMLFTASVGNVILNNTIYGPSNTHAAISQASTSTGALVENNIFYTGAYASVDASSESSTGYDYNDYFSASGTPFSWGGVAYNFADWQTNSSEDADSVTSNPALVNAAPILSGGNYALQNGSPMIDAGVDFVIPYNFELMPSSTWPKGVAIGNQYNYAPPALRALALGWEIGAYIFPNAITTPSKLGVLLP